MADTIHVSPAARSVFESLEPALRQELLEHAVLIVDDPVGSLRRSRPPEEPAGMWAHEYKSTVVDRLWFVLLVSGLDLEPRELVLTRIARFMTSDES